MMTAEYREIYAYLETITILSKITNTPPTEDQQKVLEVIKEIIQRLGQADFPMDVVSHLSMKIGKAYKTYDGE